jgi:hypothetical protein
MTAPILGRALSAIVLFAGSLAARSELDRRDAPLVVAIGASVEAVGFVLAIAWIAR